MSKDHNRATFTGNLARKPEIRHVAGSGKTVASFNIGVNSSQNKTLWIKVSAWEKVGETCAKYLDKGSRVLVSGELSRGEWTTQQGEARVDFELSVWSHSDLTFLSPPIENQAGQGYQQPQPAPAPAPSGGAGNDDIPF